MRKQYVLITGVLALGAAAVLMMERKEAEGNDPRLRVSVFNAEQFSGVEKISITQGEQNAVLEKVGEGEWQVVPQAGGQGTGQVVFPADAKQVAALVDSLGKAKVQELIATKKSSWTGMGLDAPKNVVFSGKDKEIFSANFGDVKKTGGQFVSFGSEEKAYVISEAVTLNLDHASWELKTLINLKPENIKAVTFHPIEGKSLKPAKISRAKVEDPFTVEEINSAKPIENMVTGVGSSLSEVTFIKRLDIGNEEAKTAMLNPSKFTFDLFDGRVVTGLVGRIDGAQPKFFLHIEVAQGASTAKLDPASEQVNRLMTTYAFEVSSWIGERLSRSYSDFVEGESAGTPAAKKPEIKREKKPKKASASPASHSGAPGPG